MNRFRSHKVVEAAPIMAAERNSADGPWRVAVLGGEIIEAPNNLFARGIPDWIGDADRAPMLVRYEDGFISWSPRQPFEDGYRVEDRPMTFGHALERLKAGARIARQGWNGKGMWLALSGPLAGREIAFENFWSTPCSEYARENGGSAVVLPCINMKTADGSILMGWLASQTDMLAEDWTELA